MAVLLLSASMQPIKPIDAGQMIARMSPAAQADLSEWTTRGLRPDVETVL